MLAARPLKRCLVTGASGFVGRTLCEQLQREGITVRALLRTPRQGPWDESVICDINSPEETARNIFSGIDTVFYLASIAHNKESASQYEKFNVSACLNFARLSIQHGVRRFVYVSSTKAMAKPKNKTVDEQFCEWPKDHYGLSKKRAEEGLLAITGFEHLVILRPCLIYGRGVQGNLYRMLNWIDSGIFPALAKSPAKRSMVSVRDVASALIRAAIVPVAHRKIYIVSDNTPYSLHEIEHAMRHALHKNKPLFFLPAWLLDRLLGPAVYSSEKIQRELGWHPTENFMQVLPEIVDDFISRKKSS